MLSGSLLKIMKIRRDIIVIVNYIPAGTAHRAEPMECAGIFVCIYLAQLGMR
jgi:hypothetical protein